MTDTKQQTFKVDLLKVLHTIEENENNPKATNIPKTFGVSKEFENNMPIRKISAINVEFESKTKVLAEYIKLIIERCTTDEEAFYLLYYAIMQFALESAVPDPGEILLKLLMGGRK